MTQLGTKHKTSFGASQGKVILPPNLIGAGNTNMATAKNIIKDYKTLELPDNKLEGMNEHFSAWTKDDSIIDGYQGMNLIRDGKLVVRLYRYEAPISNLLLDEAGASGIMGIKILPYVKVLKAGSNSKLKPGDILTVSNEITKFRTNQAWLEWKVLTDTDGTQIPEPEKLVGMLSAWRENSIRLNPLKPTEDDDFTFVVSEMEMLADVTYLKLN